MKLKLHTKYITKGGEVVELVEVLSYMDGELYRLGFYYEGYIEDGVTKYYWTKDGYFSLSKSENYYDIIGEYNNLVKLLYR